MALGPRMTTVLLDVFNHCFRRAHAAHELNSDILTSAKFTKELEQNKSRVIEIEETNTAAYYCARVIIVEYHRLSDLDHGNIFSHSSGGWKSKIKVLAGLSPEAPLLDLQVAVSVCAFTCSSSV